MKHKQHNIMTQSRKTFRNAAGKWVEKKTRTEILVCVSCAGKYIKTSNDQALCLRCTYAPRRSNPA